MNIAKTHAVLGLIYMIVAMIVGLVMALSNTTGLVVTHAHVMLIGGVLSVLYGAIAHLWVHGHDRALRTQLIVHNAGTLVLGALSPLFYATDMSHAVLGPVLGVASVVVLIGTIHMLVLVMRSEG